jgi:Predicted translation initiation factor 2B subunit, eIF-2B alpha/beta/delta family
VRTVAWDDDAVVLIDQRKLPHEEVYLRCRRPAEVAAAIRDMAVRGAPAIGVSAAFGIALGARLSTAEGAALRHDFEEVCEQMRVTRPPR